MIKAILMGLLQGLTEFLPVSSSGHLVVLKHLLKIKEMGIEWEVFLHAGTLLSIIVYFNKRLLKYLKPKLLGLIIIASIPAGIVGLVFKDTLESFFSSPALVIPSFVFTGIVLLIAGSRKEKNGKMPLWWQALLIGIAQSIALIPGISRSGMSVSAGILLGLTFGSAFEFSFAMAVPALLGAFLLELHDTSFASIEIGPILVGTLVSFVSGIFAIYVFRKLLIARKLQYFSIYLFLLSLLLPLLLVMR